MFFFEKVFFLIGIPISLICIFFLKKYRDQLKQKRTLELDNFHLLQEISEKFPENGLPKLWINFSRILVICFLWISLSQPVIQKENLIKATQIILAIDVSKSMQAEDFKPNRIEAAKIAALEFLERLPRDTEVALETFDQQPMIRVNFTKNHNLIKSALKKIDLEYLGDGTGLGRAILRADQAFKRKNKKSKQKNIILLTDGESNIGIEPIEALTKITGIKIYTIGIGSILGTTVQGGVLTKLDSEALREIASLTEGEFFRAFSSTKELKEIYNSLSKNYRFELKNYRLSFYFLLASLVIICILFIKEFLEDL